VQKKIFDRFYKIDHRSHTEGTGIGLAMVKEFSELLGGSVEVVNGPLKGALFSVSIPIEIVEEPEQSISNPTEKTGEKPMVVLVEDHPEMNSFIASLLAESYQVRTALTAEDGWSLISEYLPDLVITDLMLPGMSGEMLCKRIKTSSSTDHLPVLALSAKQSTDTKVEMYAYGADNYLTKPFDSDELKSVVHGLIDQRQKLKAKFRGAYGNQALKSEGMRRIEEIISEKMRQPDFGPRDLEVLMGMNRNQLQRKIKAVTGHTPVEYIRVMRLEFAHNLIKRNGVSVSEAAYASGFNQLAYFSKVYKSHFGESPSAHASKYKNEFK
jgi:DNA-binding response OmpR family regulator